MSGSHGKKLGAEARKAALSSVKKAKTRATSQSPGGQDLKLKQVLDESRNKTPSFSSLQGFQELKLQRLAAETLKIENPFFRPHDGKAGATTSIHGQSYINFASYDYLGINGHPTIVAAAKSAIDRYGISAGASRVVGGERPVHAELEEKIADLYGVEAAVVFVSGHATNVSTIGAILGADDIILHDSFIHNSIVTGAKLSGASRQTFQHNDLDALERQLIRRIGSRGRVLVVVEGVYSMDGDSPDLGGLLELKRKYGFWLMVDEAHGLGILGKTGRGLHEHYGVDGSEVDIWMGTCSKTLAGCGGYIAASRDLTDYLKFAAAGFVFSVGMPPVIAASISAAIDVMLAEPERVQKVQKNGQWLLERAKSLGLETGSSMGHAVVPIMIGNSIKATVMAARLMEEGVNVLPIIYPAVPERSSRLRFFVTSEHSKEQLEKAMAAVVKVSGDYDRNPITLDQMASLFQ